MSQQESSAPPPQPSPQEYILQMSQGHFLSQSLYAVAHLGIADLLADGPHDTAWLAQRTNTHELSLYRLLRALASFGVFRETLPRTFELTPPAALLRTRVPGSMRSAVRLLAGQEHYRAWGVLLHSLQTGKPAFDHAFGMGIFEFLERHPDSATVFDEAMTDFTDIEGMAGAYDFSSAGTVIDVGGGQGSLLAAILRANPKARGVLFDLPHVIEGAKERGLFAKELAERCRLEAGSFFETVPTGGDTYILKHVLHDWDDAQALTILTNCRKAVGPHGKLLVLELVVPPGNEPDISKMEDINMLVMTHGGRERTEEEFRALFQQAGFRLARSLRTPFGSYYLECVPA
jgi:hypothetical protein